MPMRKWHKQGWETLGGNQPGVVAFRERVLRHLWEVPEPNRSAWEKRLKSKLDHSHFSVRLEISLHHFFKERGWEIDIEPELPGTSNRPDFRIRRGASELLMEAKTVLDPQPVDQQDKRLKILVDGVSDSLSRAVSIHPCFDLPPSLPYRQITAEIEKKASGAELLQELRIEGEHQGHPYSLDVTILLADEQTSPAGVGATIGQAYTVDIGNPIRKAIQEKAIKYGAMDVPFVVAVWPKLGSHFSHPNDDDLVALYGDEGLDLSSNQLGGEVPSELGSLSNLRQLRLDGNSSLSGPLPGSFTGLTSLTILWLGGTQLCVPTDAAFQT